MSKHLPEIALATMVVLVVGMMIVPLPTWLLDGLIATNLSLALLLLLTSLFVQRPLSFGALPTLLLITTLYRLALNVSSTRLILLQADAGDVIASFGDFVVRGDYLVGAVIFAIITLVQFVVVARGAERVAEVGARFTLDAMPGKQLSIDADLRSGLLDAQGAATRRRELERESQFYGAMDGAMKFVKGDAIAAIVITVVNILGGLAVGVLEHGMDLGRALEVYGLLTIGDGLASQIPALLISTAAGLVVTRVASEDADGTLGGDIGRQLFSDWRALAVGATFALALAMIPGLPFAPFAALAALLAGVATFLYRRRPPPRPLRRRDPSAPRAHPLELLVGSRLGRALSREESFRVGLEDAAGVLYAQLGVRIEAFEPELGAGLEPDDYEVHLGGVRVDRGRCPEGRRFAEGSVEELRARDPEVEIDGSGGWIRGDGVAAAEVLVARVLAAARARPHELVGIQETQRELDHLAREAPALVRHVIPERLDVARFAALLRALVAERVDIGGLREILEAASQDPLPAEPAQLVSIIRERLARPITHGFADAEGTLRVRPVDPMIEEALRDEPLDPELADEIIAAVRRAAPEGGVLLTRSDVRFALRELLRAELPDVPILSYAEIDPEAPIERLAMVSP